MKILYAILISLYFFKQYLEYTFALDVYPIISAILIMIILINFTRLFSSKDVLLFVVVIIFSFFSTLLINQNLNENYLELVFLYMLQPLAIFSFFIGKKENYVLDLSRSTLSMISFSSIPIFLGCLYFYLVHLYNVQDIFEIYTLEYTSTAGSFTIRNTSFMGSSLMLAGISLIQFLASKYLEMKSNKKIFTYCAFLALMSIAFSLSRRGILPVMLYYSLILFWYSKSRGTKLISYSFGILTIVFIVSPGLLEILYLRVFSIFDIVNDTSNISRIELMSRGIIDILRQPWGLGFGSLSSVGYSVEQVWESENIRVTESSIISFIGELGILASAVLFVTMYNKIRKLNKRVIGLFFLPLFLESIVGLGIYGPAVSFFTISFLFAVYSLEKHPRFERSNHSENPQKTLSSAF